MISKRDVLTSWVPSFKRLGFFAFALAPFFVTTVASADQVTDDFRRSAQAVPQRLIQLGYTQIGGVDLHKTLQEASTIQVNSTGFFQRAEPVIEGFETARSGAQWQRSATGARIDVNRGHWTKSTSDEKSVIGLHEILGVSGFNDRNYQLSTPLWLLSLPQSSQLAAGERQQLEKRIQVASSGGGSITGVGGGGDPAGVKIRIKVLKATLNRVVRSSESWARQQAMQNLFGDFEISEEVRWNQDGMKDVQIEITPAGASEYTDFLKACERLQSGTKKFRDGVFKFIQRNDPEKARYYGDSNGLLRECERVEKHLGR
jgi:hypothetical protein